MLRRFISTLVTVSFIASYYQPIYAQNFSINQLPMPGTMVSVSPSVEPALIRGLTVHKDNPFLFDFIVDPGQSKMSKADLKDESGRMIKYFFAALTIPDRDIWVNLSPYEKERMVPASLGQTAMGRDLLAQDYMLKQLTASLIYPQKTLGKTFWTKVYAKAKEMYGNTQIPVNTFNKVWIVPQRVGIYEHGQTAFIVDGHLKVMLEEDYLALEKHSGTHSVIARNPQGDEAIFKRTANAQRIASSLAALVPRNDTNLSPSEAIGPFDTHALSSQLIRQIILPEIEREINNGKNFATLRQIFYAQALAVWFKRNLKQALLNRVYANKGTVKGINQNDAATNEAIYHQYLKAYKKGVFNYIKEDIDPITKEALPRKYFSGGYGESAMLAIQPELLSNEAMESANRSYDFAVLAAGKANMAMIVNAQIERAITETRNVQPEPLRPEHVGNSRLEKFQFEGMSSTAIAEVHRDPHALDLLESIVTRPEFIEQASKGEWLFAMEGSQEMVLRSKGDVRSAALRIAKIFNLPIIYPVYNPSNLQVIMRSVENLKKEGVSLDQVAGYFVGTLVYQITRGNVEEAARRIASTWGNLMTQEKLINSFVMFDRLPRVKQMEIADKITNETQATALNMTLEEFKRGISANSGTKKMLIIAGYAHVAELKDRADAAMASTERENAALARIKQVYEEAKGQGIGSAGFLDPQNLRRKLEIMEEDGELCKISVSMSEFDFYDQKYEEARSGGIVITQGGGARRLSRIGFLEALADFIEQYRTQLGVPIRMLMQSDLAMNAKHLQPGSLPALAREALIEYQAEGSTTFRRYGQLSVYVGSVITGGIKTDNQIFLDDYEGKDVDGLIRGMIEIADQLGVVVEGFSHYKKFYYTAKPGDTFNKVAEQNPIVTKHFQPGSLPELAREALIGYQVEGSTTFRRYGQLSVYVGYVVTGGIKTDNQIFLDDYEGKDVDGLIRGMIEIADQLGVVVEGFSHYKKFYYTAKPGDTVEQVAGQNPIVTKHFQPGSLPALAREALIKYQVEGNVSPRKYGHFLVMIGNVISGDGKMDNQIFLDDYEGKDVDGLIRGMIEIADQLGVVVEGSSHYRKFNYIANPGDTLENVKDRAMAGDETLRQLFQDIDVQKLGPDRIQQRLQEIFPKGQVQFDGHYFYFNRKAIPSADHFIKMLWDNLPQLHHRLVRIMDFRLPDDPLLARNNIINPDTDPQIRNTPYGQLTLEQKNAIFTILSHRKENIFHLDHHYDFPVFATTSTTPMLLDYLKWLHQQPGGLEKIKELQGAFAFMDHSDTDILLANYLITKANDLRFLQSFGDILAQAALLNDYGINPKDNRGSIVFNVTSILEKEIYGGKLTFPQAFELIDQTIHFAQRFSYLSEKGLADEIRHRTVVLDDKEAVIARHFLEGVQSYLKDMEQLTIMFNASTRNLHNKDIVPGEFRRMKNILFVYVKDGQEEIGNMSVLRFCQSVHPELLAGLSAVVTSSPASKSSSGRTIKVRTFIKKDGSFFNLSERIWKQFAALGYGTPGGRALAGAFGKEPLQGLTQEDIAKIANSIDAILNPSNAAMITEKRFDMLREVLKYAGREQKMSALREVGDPDSYDSYKSDGNSNYMEKLKDAWGLLSEAYSSSQDELLKAEAVKGMEALTRRAGGSDFFWNFISDLTSPDKIKLKNAIVFLSDPGNYSGHDILGDMRFVLKEFRILIAGHQEPAINGYLIKGIGSLSKAIEERKGAAADAAMRGGIDLSQQDAAMHVTKDANGGVKVSVDPALIAKVEREGMPELDPVIIDMEPVNIKFLFGRGG